jgi:DinB family protein
MAEGQEKILRRLAATVRAVQSAVQRWPEPALDRYQLPNPLLGRLTVGEMLAFSVYHHGHHLRRIAERSQGEMDMTAADARPFGSATPNSVIN